MNKDKLTVNILIVGDSGVGKTALLVRFCDDEFNASSISTVGIEISYFLWTYQLYRNRL